MAGRNYLEIYRKKLSADAEKRKARIRKQWEANLAKANPLSRKEFAAKRNMTRQNLERLIKD